MANKSKAQRRPDRLSTYFYQERGVLTGVAFSGILYNLGLTAGPFFEGQLTLCLTAVLAKEKTGADMAGLALAYLAVILIVLSGSGSGVLPMIRPVRCGGCCTAISFIKIPPL